MENEKWRKSTGENCAAIMWGKELYAYFLFLLPLRKFQQVKFGKSQLKMQLIELWLNLDVNLKSLTPLTPSSEFRNFKISWFCCQIKFKVHFFLFIAILSYPNSVTSLDPPAISKRAPILFSSCFQTVIMLVLRFFFVFSQ